MKRKLLSLSAVVLLAGVSYAGVAKFSFKHVVKPVAKASAHAVVKSAKLAKKVLW